MRLFSAGALALALAAWEAGPKSVLADAVSSGALAAAAALAYCSFARGT